jgi:hypothetical protein
VKPWSTTERHQPPTCLVLFQQQTLFAEVVRGRKARGPGADDHGALALPCFRDAGGGLWPLFLSDTRDLVMHASIRPRCIP